MVNNKKLKDLGECIELSNSYSPEPPTPQPPTSQFWQTHSVCSRCNDIHVAQRSGLTIHPCKCDCHIGVSHTTFYTTEYHFSLSKFSDTTGM
jgi:hypothetical protein